MSVKNFIRDYLSFSKRDRLGILIVVTLIVLIYFLPYYFSSSYKPVSLTRNSFPQKWADSIELRKGRMDSSEEEFTNPLSSAYFKESPAGEVFVFDPNLLDAAGWKRLGLKERTIKTILNYRNKGGRFRKPGDLEKIWGLPPGFYERVKNFVRIEQEDPILPAGNKQPIYERKSRSFATVSINEADTAAFIALPGIGNKLASRIVNFRDKLGGFHTTDQVKEVYGLADSVFQKIKSYLVLSGDVKKININRATKDELKAHPYFRWNLSNAIVEYRTQHGEFRRLEELKNIALIDESLYKKIVPYLMVGE